MSRWRLAVVALAGLAASGCAGAPPGRVVPARELPTAGANPSIEAIVELGGGDVPAVGELRPPAGDGVVAIGEALWIRGRAFGRQPTVSIGGRPAAVLSRTADGGILVRVPPSTPAGIQDVVVTQERAQCRRSVQVRRYLVTRPPVGGVVAVASVDGEGVTPGGGIELAGALHLAMSADGRAVYTTGAAGGSLTVLDLAAQGGPRARAPLPLGPGPVVALLAPAYATRGVAVRERDAVILDLRSPLRPARAAVVDLPAEIRDGKVRAARLAPDGRHLALALGAGNRIVFLDLERLVAGLGRPVVGDLALAPDVIAPVIADLAFSSDGGTLWAVLGDTPESAALGPQATRVYALRVKVADGGKIVLQVARTIELSLLHAPLRVLTGRAAPLESGAAIRLPPENATVYVVAGSREADRAMVVAIGAQDEPVELLRMSGRGRVGGLDLTPDGTFLLASVLGGAGEALVIAARADGRPGERKITPLLPPPDPAPAAGAPMTPGDLFVQP